MSYLRFPRKTEADTSRYDYRRPSPKELQDLSRLSSHSSLNYLDQFTKLNSTALKIQNFKPISQSNPRLQKKQLFENRRANFFQNDRQTSGCFLSCDDKENSNINLPKKKMKQHQVEAARLIANRLQRYFQSLFDQIRNHDEQFNTLESLIVEKKIFQEAPASSPKNEHITALQGQLDKIEQSIRLSAAIPIKESKILKMQDSQIVNGFKVSFANLSNKHQVNSDRHPAQFKDRIKDLKSLMENIGDNESRPLKVQYKPQQPKQSTPVAEVDKTITSFECNFSSLKESQHDSHNRGTDKSGKYNSFTRMLQNKEEELSTQTARLQNPSLEDLLSEGQSMQCSFTLPQHHHNVHHLNQLSSALSGSLKRIKSQALQSIQVFALKKYLGKMNQKFLLIRKDALRRIIQSKIKMERIMKKVCLERWTSNVEYRQMVNFYSMKLFKLFEGKLKSHYSSIKARSDLQRRTDNLFKGVLKLATYPVITTLLQYSHTKRKQKSMQTIEFIICMQYKKLFMYQCRLRQTQKCLEEPLQGIVKKKCQQNLVESFKMIKLQALSNSNKRKLICTALMEIEWILDRKKVGKFFTLMQAVDVPQKKQKSPHIYPLVYVLRLIILRRSSTCFLKLATTKPQQPGMICQSFVLDDSPIDVKQHGMSLFEQYKALFQK